MGLYARRNFPRVRSPGSTPQRVEHTEERGRVISLKEGHPSSFPVPVKWRFHLVVTLASGLALHSLEVRFFLYKQQWHHLKHSFLTTRSRGGSSSPLIIFPVTAGQVFLFLLPESSRVMKAQIRSAHCLKLFTQTMIFLKLLRIRKLGAILQRNIKF